MAAATATRDKLDRSGYDRRMIFAEKAELIDLDTIDARKNYTCTIQIGAQNAWRDFGGGKWERNPEADDNKAKQVGMKHVPAIHDAGPLSGKIVKGLAQAHNDWVEANKRGERPKGMVARQLLVSNIRATEDALPDSEKFTSDRDMLRAVVTETVTALVPAIVKELLTATNKGSSK